MFICCRCEAVFYSGYSSGYWGLQIPLAPLYLFPFDFGFVKFSFSESMHPAVCLAITQCRLKPYWYSRRVWEWELSIMLCLNLRLKVGLCALVDLHKVHKVSIVALAPAPPS